MATSTSSGSPYRPTTTTGRNSAPRKELEGAHGADAAGRVGRLRPAPGDDPDGAQHDSRDGHRQHRSALGT